MPHGRPTAISSEARRARRASPSICALEDLPVVEPGEARGPGVHQQQALLDARGVGGQLLDAQRSRLEVDRRARRRGSPPGSPGRRSARRCTAPPRRARRPERLRRRSAPPDGRRRRGRDRHRQRRRAAQARARRHPRLRRHLRRPSRCPARAGCRRPATASPPREDLARRPSLGLAQRVLGLDAHALAARLHAAPARGGRWPRSRSPRRDGTGTAARCRACRRPGRCAWAPCFDGVAWPWRRILASRRYDVRPRRRGLPALRPGRRQRGRPAHAAASSSRSCASARPRPPPAAGRRPPRRAASERRASSWLVDWSCCSARSAPAAVPAVREPAATRAPAARGPRAAPGPAPPARPATAAASRRWPPPPRVVAGRRAEGRGIPATDHDAAPPASRQASTTRQPVGAADLRIAEEPLRALPERARSCATCSMASLLHARRSQAARAARPSRRRPPARGRAIAPDSAQRRRVALMHVLLEADDWAGAEAPAARRLALAPRRPRAASRASATRCSGRTATARRPRCCGARLEIRRQPRRPRALLGAHPEGPRRRAGHDGAAPLPLPRPLRRRGARGRGPRDPARARAPLRDPDGHVRPRARPPRSR